MTDKKLVHKQPVGRPVTLEPSELQVEVLSSLIRWVCTRGFQPSRRELAEEFGITAPAINRRIVELGRRRLVGSTGRRSVQLLGMRFVQTEGPRVERNPIWLAIIEAVEKNGFQPSIDELAETLSVTAVQVRNWANHLRSLGVIGELGDRSIELKDVRYKCERVSFV